MSLLCSSLASYPARDRSETSSPLRFVSWAWALDIHEIAVVVKERVSGTARSAIVVDDIISTGRTLQAAVASIRRSWTVDTLHLAATHAVLTDGAIERVLDLAPDQVVVSDTVDHDDLREPFEVVGTAGILTRQIRSLSGLSPDAVV